MIKDSNSYSAPSKEYGARHEATLVDYRTILAFMVVMMLGGLFPVISQLSRFSLWGVWLLMWWLAIRAPKSESLGALSKPAVPFAVWLVAFSLWGAIVSPVPVLSHLGPDLFHFFTSMMALSVIVSDRDSLERLAKFTPWILTLNLLVTIALVKQIPAAEILFSRHIAHAAIQTGTDRFSGLWGNANMGGMDTLILLVLSLYGRGWFVWFGRLAGIIIIYFTASRTATYLLILIFLLLLYEYSRNSLRLRWAIIFVFLVLLLSGIRGTLLTLETYVPEGSPFSRIFDPLELNTRTAGGETRLLVMRTWLSVLSNGPWYGYGYGAMNGGGSMGVVFRTDIPYMGTHNMFLGTFADDGYLGLISFLMILALGLLRTVRARLPSSDRTVVRALWMIALVFGCFAHALQASIDGQILYLLCFFLPARGQCARMACRKRFRFLTRQRIITNLQGI